MSKGTWELRQTLIFLLNPDFLILFKSYLKFFNLFILKNPLNLKKLTYNSYSNLSLSYKLLHN